MTANEWADTWKQRYSGRATESLTAEEQQERQIDWKRGQLLALEKMVLGVMEATAIAYRAQMPDPLPDLQAMASQQGETHFFRLNGMYGGFSLELHDADGDAPYILAECWCRVFGGSQMLRRITTNAVEIVSQGLY